MAAEFRKPPEDEDDMPTVPAWMATFSDMMTLLMCFFILIMSFSTMEIDKFKLAMGSLKGAFGVQGVLKDLRPDQSWFSPSPADVYSARERSILDHVQRLRNIIEENELSEKVEVDMANGEVFVQIKDNMLFYPGSGELRPNYLKLLSLIAKMFFKDMQQILVEGHTDDIPIHTKEYPSNWELSFERALNVLRYFVNEEKIDPGKLMAAGYGEHKPVVPNNSPENRAKNRRVVLRMKI